MEYGEAIKILNKENIDLDEFETSEEYACLCHCFAYGRFYKELQGFPVTIDGNVEQIIISGRDEIKLLITYSLRADGLYQEQVATVIVEDNRIKAWIRSNLRPSTRLKCIASYNGVNRIFNLVSIVDTSPIMRFGHYICDKCKHDYGKKITSSYCCICDEGELSYIDNFYQEVLQG